MCGVSGTVEQLPSGRWRARKKNAAGKYRSLPGTFETEELANAALGNPPRSDPARFAFELFRTWLAFERNATGTDGLIYVAVSGSTHFKFGFTRDRDRLARRMRDLKTLCPTAVSLLAWTVGRIGIERWIHSELAPYRSQGEWYLVCGPVMQMAAAIALAEPWSPVVAEEMVA